MFSVTATDGLARCGSLLTRHGAAMPTPAALLYTRRGGCMYLTPDMMEKLKPEAHMLQIDAMQFLHQPDADLLKQFGRSLHHYLGTPSWPIIAVNRDPLLLEYGVKPASDAAANVLIHSGCRQVTPEAYMDAIEAMQPDMFVAMADEVPAGSKRKKVVLSTDRTLNWLNLCLERHEAAAVTGTSGTGSPAQRLILAPVVGSDQADERERAAKGVAALPVAGFALCGFGMGETLTQQAPLMRAAVAHLPAAKPRLVLGLGSPEEVVQAVGQGVDIFDCSYPSLATTGGYALSFPLSPEQEHADGGGDAGGEQPSASSSSSSSSSTGDAGSDDTKHNLWSLDYRNDKRPLVVGCSCFTCQNHTRAYLHHLLHTHEMLASVLLEMHNTHWWLAFFAALRAAIARGGWEEYCLWFEARKRPV